MTDDSPEWWVSGWLACIAHGPFAATFNATTPALRRQWAEAFARSPVALGYDTGELIEAFSGEDGAGVLTEHPLWELFTEATSGIYRPHISLNPEGATYSVSVIFSDDGEMARVLLLPPTGGGARVAAELRGFGVDVVRYDGDEWHIDGVIPDCPTPHALSIHLGQGSQN